MKIFLTPTLPPRGSTWMGSQWKLLWTDYMQMIQAVWGIGSGISKTETRCLQPPPLALDQNTIKSNSHNNPAASSILPWPQLYQIRSSWPPRSLHHSPLTWIVSSQILMTTILHYSAFTYTASNHILTTSLQPPSLGLDLNNIKSLTKYYVWRS